MFRKDGSGRVREGCADYLMPLRMSAFPKCYLEQISTGQMTVFEWFDQARTLDADGLEMYEGFLVSHDPPYLEELASAIHSAGFAMPMMCCSPDFTAPDPEKRKRALEHEIDMIRITRVLGGTGAVCRVLSGQRYPEVSWEQGREWVLNAIGESIKVATEYDVVLGMENHYKDGFWTYPEFAQKLDRFVNIVSAFPDKEHFGVQYDPSNALVAGDDPIELLQQVADRVVSMHASDRYLAPGTTLDQLRQSDGTLGYSENLRHGVTGKGLNDYDRIFSILAQSGYKGWVSIEDGMNGMDEMAESLAFLRRMSERHFS